jgi:hypothetical protein
VVGSQLRIAGQQLLRSEQPRRIGAVRHVEQHSQQTSHRQYDVQLRESQYSEPRRDRDGPEEHRPAQIRSDEHRQTADSINPSAREQPDQEPGSRLAGAQ